MPDKLQLQSEALAYWYFRLNGCLTITNFVVHPEIGRDQRTDVDVIAVRFPFRAELLANPMQDDALLAADRHRTRIILAEIKLSRCNLNGPWTDPGRRNMLRVVRAIGSFPRDLTPSIANNLYKHGLHIDSLYNMSLFCIGSERNEDIAKRLPSVPQVTWDHLLNFIFDRFRQYSRQKVAHPQWDDIGKTLWDHAMKSQDFESFKNGIEVTA